VSVEACLIDRSASTCAFGDVSWLRLGGSKQLVRELYGPLIHAELLKAEHADGIGRSASLLLVDDKVQGGVQVQVQVKVKVNAN
jgi:hypothetical protein